MRDLYETYDRVDLADLPADRKLMPVCHTTQQAHIEIVLDGYGNFRSAKVLPKGSETLIPCTEESAGRTGQKPVNHPLCDKLQYVAGDFVRFGGEVTSGFSKEPEQPFLDYRATLEAWTKSGHGHPKLEAILAYVERKTVVADLVRCGVLPVDGEGNILRQWPKPIEKSKGKAEENDVPAIYLTMKGIQGGIDGAFVRWRVEHHKVVESTGTWEDNGLMSAWIGYYNTSKTNVGLCVVTGVETALATQHPAKIRNAADKAKLISANDSNGFTYRGRFSHPDQAAGVGFIVTQKAHNALRWLIERQGIKNGNHTILAWSLGGQKVPDPCRDSRALFVDEPEFKQEADPELEIDYGDFGQHFATSLESALKGYHRKLDNEHIVVLALDAATPGRSSINYYRKFRGSEYLDRLERWFSRYSWRQHFGAESKFVGTPSVWNIVEAAYGKRVDDNYKKTAIESLLPSIIDGMPVPSHFINNAMRRTCNRGALDRWEFEKLLGITCALFRGNSIFKNEVYGMSLDTSRTTRDYLFGRLLAVADNIEQFALHNSEKKRDTTAAKLMYQFSMRPADTWKNINMGLQPYKSRLRGSEKGIGLLIKREKLLDEIHNAFDPNDFLDNKPLSAEFLLGYHCQRSKLLEKSTPSNNTDSIN